MIANAAFFVVLVILNLLLIQVTAWRIDKTIGGATQDNE